MTVVLTVGSRLTRTKRVPSGFIACNQSLERVKIEATSRTSMFCGEPRLDALRVEKVIARKPLDTNVVVVAFLHALQANTALPPAFVLIALVLFRSEYPVDPLEQRFTYIGQRLE